MSLTWLSSFIKHARGSNLIGVSKLEERLQFDKFIKFLDNNL